VNLLRLPFNLVFQVEYTKALSSSPPVSGRSGESHEKVTIGMSRNHLWLPSKDDVGHPLWTHCEQLNEFGHSMARARFRTDRSAWCPNGGHNNPEPNHERWKRNPA
jgi:hypothetical protein